MDWTTLAPTALGGLLAVGGGFIGQWWGERRSVAREQREREHEREVWTREKGYQAHVTFITEYERKFKDFYEWQTGPAGQPQSRPLPDFAGSRLSDLLSQMRLTADHDAERLAWTALNALGDYMRMERPDAMAAMSVRVNFRNYLDAVRKEFGLSDRRHEDAEMYTG